MRTPEEIIPTQQVNLVHGNANFGPRDNRSVINEALLKVACRFANGSTATMILMEHRLIIAPSVTDNALLTEKGRKYLWSVFGKGIP